MNSLAILFLFVCQNVGKPNERERVFARMRKGSVVAETIGPNKKFTHLRVTNLAADKELEV